MRQGYVEWVDTIPARSFASVAADAGQPVVLVEDGSPFFEGTQVSSAGEVYDVLSVDAPEADGVPATLVLGANLLAAIEVGDPIDVYPEQLTAWAGVSRDDEIDTVTIRVPQTPQVTLALGIRAPESREVVTYEEGSDGLEITSIDGRALIQGELIDPDSTIPQAALTDGLPPVDAPVVVASPFGVGAVQADWEPLDKETNPDPATFLIHASLTSPVPEDGTALVSRTMSTLGRVAMVGGVALPAEPTTVYMKIQSSDADGLGPFSDEVSATTRSADGFITTAFLAALEIEANQIRAGRFEAGTGIFGDFIEVDGDASTITMYADTEHTVPLIQMRPDGSVFRGRVEADDISVLNGLIILGIESRIAEGAGVTIASGVADPGSPPTLTAVTAQSKWPAVPAGYTQRNISWDPIGVRWLRILVPISPSSTNRAIAQRISSAGAIVGDDVVLANVPGGEVDYSGIVRRENYLFALIKIDTDWYLGRWNTGGVWANADDFGLTYITTGVVGRPVLGLAHDSDTDVLIAYVDAAGMGVERWATGGDEIEYVGFELAPIPWGSRSTNLSYVAAGDFDFGAYRVVVGSGLGVYSYDWNTEVEQTAERFSIPSSASDGGVGWDGSNFYSTHGANTLHKYSACFPAADQKAYVDYADTGSGDITLPSPVAEIAIPARRYLQIALPVGGASSSDVFMGLGTTAPADSAMLKRSETLMGRNMLVDPTVAGSGVHTRLRTLTSVTRSGTTATGTTSTAHGYSVGDEVLIKGAAVPLSGAFEVLSVPSSTTFTYAVPNSGSTATSGTVLANTFGAGAPGWLKTQLGGFIVRGDGSGEWPAVVPTKFSDYTPTLTNFPAGTTVAARYMRLGKMVTVRFCITLGGTPTSGVGNLVMSTPSPTANPLVDITYGEGWGTCMFYDRSVGAVSRRPGVVVPVNVSNNTRVGFAVDNLSTSALVTDAVPWVWATSDLIAGTFTYEEA